MEKRESKSIGIGVVIFLIIVGIIWVVMDKDETDGLGTSSEIYRSFASSSVNADESIEVSISFLNTNNKRYYAIEEYVPTDWTIIDTGGGARNITVAPNTLKWTEYSMSALSDKTFTYTVQAPSTPGSYEFTGIYMTEGMDSSAPIKGDSSIEVE